MLRRVLVGSCLIVGLCVAATTAGAADKLGKLFVKAAGSDAAASGGDHVPIGGGQQFVDRSLTDTVKDIKSRHGDFVIADQESDAQFLLIVLHRTTLQNDKKAVSATLSVRDGDSWKPLCKITNGSGKLQTTWAMAARGLISDAEKCARENAQKR